MVNVAGSVGGLEAPGVLEWEAMAAFVDDLAVAFGAETMAITRVGVRGKATELVESRPRVRSGSLSPSWAA